MQCILCTLPPPNASLLIVQFQCCYMLCFLKDKRDACWVCKSVKECTTIRSSIISVVPLCCTSGLFLDAEQIRYPPTNPVRPKERRRCCVYLLSIEFHVCIAVRLLYIAVRLLYTFVKLLVSSMNGCLEFSENDAATLIFAALEGQECRPCRCLKDVVHTFARQR